MKTEIWDTGCKPAFLKISPSQLYYTKVPILAMRALPVHGRVNPIPFDSRLIISGILSLPTLKAQIRDAMCKPAP